MRHIRMLTFAFSLGGLGGVVTATAAQVSSQASSVVTIQAPVDGSGAGAEVTVKGTAKLKPGDFLWLVARRSDFEPVWWPQRPLALDPKTGQFAGSATLGNVRDVGSQFDIAVITVDAAGNQQLTEYRTNALTTGEYKPTRIPSTTSPPRVIRLKKISDR